MKEDRHGRLIEAMMELYRGDAKRIQHFLKVWGFARTIGAGEGLDERTRFIPETAAIVHDIGIHTCEEKFGNCAGKLQELEGAPLAEKLLTQLGYEQEVIDRVSWLVGHHHTYSDVTDIDHQILLEADFLVNSFEDAMEIEQIRRFRDAVFRTRTGTRLLNLQWNMA